MSDSQLRVRRRGDNTFFNVNRQGNITGAVSVPSNVDTSGVGGVSEGDRSIANQTLRNLNSAVRDDQRTLTVEEDQINIDPGGGSFGSVSGIENRTGFGSDVNIGGGLSFNNRNTVQGDVTTSDEAAFDNREQGDVTGSVRANDSSSVTNRGNIQGSVETRDQSSFANRETGRVQNDVNVTGGSSATNAGEIGRNVTVQDQGSFENQGGGVVANNVSLVDNARGRFRNDSRVGGNVSAQDNALASFERRAEVGGQIQAESESNVELPSRRGLNGGRFSRGAGPAGGIRIGETGAGSAPQKNPRTRPLDSGPSGGALGQLQGGGARRRRLLG